MIGIHVSTKVKKLSRRLETKRQSLLASYDDEQLHKLRITLRRMRSYLKRQSGSKARRLRGELAGLADQTNPARDWDTLVTHARSTLDPQEFERVQPVLEGQRARTHRQLARTLESKRWFKVTRRWNRFTAKHLPPQPSPGAAPDAVDKTMRRVEAARRGALSSNKDKQWHKLRIAIKDLRYTLDNIPAKLRDDATQNMLAHCKSLQDDLGNWHDAVQHRRLLLNFLQEQEQGLAEPVKQALIRLCQAFKQEREARLEHVRSTLVALP
jgi:CHAD domain-containing protein